MVNRIRKQNNPTKYNTSPLAQFFAEYTFNRNKKQADLDSEDAQLRLFDADLSWWSQQQVASHVRSEIERLICAVRQRMTDLEYLTRESHELSGERDG